MKIALIVASVASMIDQFNMRNIKILQNNGYKVVVACNFKNGSSCSDERIAFIKNNLTNLSVEYYQIDFTRKFYNLFKHRKAIKQLKLLLKKYNFSLLHCMSPIGALLARITAKKYRKKGLKVIYSAHGFHFYKGAPLLNWLVYYPIEKRYAKYTDYLITTNTEDFNLASKKFKTKHIVFIPGVGIDINKFKNTVIDRDLKRNDIGVPIDSFVLVSVGEVNANKNHQVIIKALGEILNDEIHYVIVGKGPNTKSLMDLAKKMNIEKNIHFLGYRTDIAEIYKACDVVVFPSIREGFGLAAIEGMASGLPLICSNNRGSKTYAFNGENSYMCDFNDIYGFKKAIEMMFYDKDDVRQKFVNKSNEILKQFDSNVIDSMIEKIYIE